MLKHKCHRSQVESMMARVRSGCQPATGILGGKLLLVMFEDGRQSRFICTIRQRKVKSFTYILVQVHFLQNSVHDTTTHNWEPRADGLVVSQLGLGSWFCGRTEPSCSSWSLATHLCNRWASNSCGAPQWRRCFTATLHLILPLGLLHSCHSWKESLCCQKHKCCLVTGHSA